jgi:hypothetical protein
MRRWQPGCPRRSGRIARWRRESWLYAKNGLPRDLLDFLARFGRPVDLLMRQRQPPVSQDESGNTRTVSRSAAFGVAISARRVQHTRERQPRARSSRGARLMAVVSDAMLRS